MSAQINVDRTQFVESRDISQFVHVNKASMEIQKSVALKLDVQQMMNAQELIHALIVNVFQLVHWKNVDQMQCVLPLIIMHSVIVHLVILVILKHNVFNWNVEATQNVHLIRLVSTTDVKIHAKRQQHVI